MYHRRGAAAELTVLYYLIMFITVRHCAKVVVAVVRWPFVHLSVCPSVICGSLSYHFALRFLVLWDLWLRRFLVFFVCVLFMCHNVALTLILFADVLTISVSHIISVFYWKIVVHISSYITVITAFTLILFADVLIIKYRKSVINVV